MLAEVRAVPLKGIEIGDLYEFKIKEQIELPLLSQDDTDTKQLFLQGSTITGVPLTASIKDLKSGNVESGEGVLVEEKSGGCYIVPKFNIDHTAEPKKVDGFAQRALTATKDTIKEVTAVTEETAKAAIDEVKNADTEKYLGFTKKQLLVMAVTVFVIVKILK